MSRLARLAIVALASVAVFIVAAPAASAQPFIRSAQSYGYAGATFDWAGPSRVSNIDLIVADWGCDAKPVYAYFHYYTGSGHVDRTPTNRYDHSGCDTGDWTEYPDLSFSVSGDSVTYLAVVICRDALNGPCQVGALSGRNPYAPF